MSVFERAVHHVLRLIYAPEKKVARMVVLLMLVGLIVRFVAALHLDVLADDMLYASQSAGILKAKILSTHSNPPLFFYLTDAAYRLLGYTTLASRLWPLLAGVMLIPLSFLIARRFYSENIALAVAFFATFANFLVRMTFTEQSLVVLFFAMFGAYLGMRYLETPNLRWLMLSACTFGLALLTKYNAPFFLLAFFVFVGVRAKLQKEKMQIPLKHALLFIVLLMVFALPFLAFNYFIYQDKGIVDVYFSRVLHVEKAQQLYQGLGGQESSFFQNLAKPASYMNWKLVSESDPLMLVFALIGLLIMIRRKEKIPLAFFALFVAIPFVLQSAGSVLHKHFAFMHFLFALPAGVGLTTLLEKIRREWRYFFIAVLCIILFVNLGTAAGTPASYPSASGTSQLKSFLQEHVKEGEVILFDSRIYTAKTFWLATDHAFLTLHQFADFYSAHQNLSAQQKRPTKVFVVECALDDCGWGTIVQNPELNASSEKIIQELQQAGQRVATLQKREYRGNEFLSDKKEVEEYRVTQLTLDLHPEFVKQMKGIQSFYFVPYLYEIMKGYVYAYNVNGFARFVESMSLLITYLAMILAVTALIAVVFLL